MTPPLSHHERQIPTISISLESEDDLLQEHRSSKKSTRSATISSADHRSILFGDETDQDDESTHFIRRTKIDGLSSNFDDEHILSRKQSKIGR